ncbi:MAG: 4-hydroxy-3-methylbut-2-enyl diphosphate reductase [Candidatus Cloacimonetes bacterium]|nr:4-hydroxy-3-methylbut-2-enyl diphosphate reductase [Candidatus Cloacimonadota bacterium]
MKLEIAANSGFCFGVKRAIQIVQETIRQNSKVATLGPIIHNPQMVNYLKNRGLCVLDNINEITDETIIIRSHGITSYEYKKLLEKEVNIVDATCPFVKKAQKYAQKLTQEGYHLFILGEKNHPEVKALLSYVDDSATVIANPEETIKITGKRKFGLIAQTTQSEDKFERLAINLLKECEELNIIKTICNATLLRQKSTMDLAKKVDIMIVIGGKNSANTNRLAEIAKSKGCKTFHIETSNEIKKQWFDDVSKVGITAGASTPKWIIDDVKKELEKLN